MLPTGTVAFATTPALVHRRTALPVHRHQLHRSADAERPGAVPEDRVHLDQHRLRAGSSSPSGSPTRSARRWPASGWIASARAPGLSIAVLWYSIAAMLTSLGGRPEVVRRRSASCSAPAKRPTGRARPRRCPSGSRAARAAGRSRCSTADRRSARPSRRSSCSWLYPHLRHVAAGLRHHRRARLHLAVDLPARCITRRRRIPGSRPEERAYILADREPIEPADGRAAPGADRHGCSGCARRGASSSARR